MPPSRPPDATIPLHPLVTENLPASHGNKEILCKYKSTGALPRIVAVAPAPSLLISTQYRFAAIANVLDRSPDTRPFEVLTTSHLSRFEPVSGSRNYATNSGNLRIAAPTSGQPRVPRQRRPGGCATSGRCARTTSQRIGRPRRNSGSGSSF